MLFILMSGFDRINAIGMLCSCVGHAAIFGGLSIVAWGVPQSRFAADPAAKGVSVDLVAANDMGQPRATPESAQSTSHPSHVSDTGFAGVREPLVRSAPAVAGQQAVAQARSDSAAVAGARGGAASSADLRAYQLRLYEAVARHARYPAEARKQRVAGVTHLAFRLDRLGNLVESWVQESSGSELLDNAALRALDQAQPLPPIPPQLPSHMEFTIEIDASLLRQQAFSSGN